GVPVAASLKSTVGAILLTGFGTEARSRNRRRLLQQHPTSLRHFSKFSRSPKAHWSSLTCVLPICVIVGGKLFIQLRGMPPRISRISKHRRRPAAAPIPLAFQA